MLRDGGILYQSHYAGLSVQRPEVDYSRVFEGICAVSASIVPIQYSFFGLSNRNLIPFQDVFRQDCDAQHGLQDPVCLLDRAAEY
jgi:hypothetical protein